MTLIDYASSAAVLAMIGSTSPSTAESTLVGQIVAGVSRQIDNWLNQVFAQQSYTAQVLRAQIDPDGILQCWPAVPTMSAPTSVAWKRAFDVSWNDISSATVEIDQTNSGCQLRVLSPNLGLYRGNRVQMRLTYTGGWASLNDVPSAFELGARRACVIEYKKRDQADMGKTAIPELGVVITPSAWPADIKRIFESYRRVVLI